MLKLFKIISWTMIPAAIIFIALRHYDMVNNNKYAIELLFIISIVTWYGLTLIWNHYIDPESYKKFNCINRILRIYFVIC